MTGDTSITLTTPPSAAGTDDVTVTGPGGTSADSAAFQFTFVPTPVVSSLNPDNGPVAAATRSRSRDRVSPSPRPSTLATKGRASRSMTTRRSPPYVPASDCGCQSDSSSVTVSSIGGVSNSATYNYTNVAPGTPDAPTIGTATAGHGSASVAFTPPVNNGGSPIISYTVTAVDNTNAANGGQSATGGSSPLTVTGLTNGDSYTFTVTATNANGTGRLRRRRTRSVPTFVGSVTPRDYDNLATRCHARDLVQHATPSFWRRHDLQVEEDRSAPQGASAPRRWHLDRHAQPEGACAPACTPSRWRSCRGPGAIRSRPRPRSSPSRSLRGRPLGTGARRSAPSTP